MIKSVVKNNVYALLAMVFMHANAYAAKLPTVVALFGDSTSVGFNSNFTERFGLGKVNFGQPSIQLSALLNDSQRPSTVANLGWGGTSSGPATAFIGSAGGGNGVDRINADLADLKTKIPGRAYYALIMYGTNDPARGIPASVTGFNNGIMIERANTQGYTAIVSSIMPCDVCAHNVVSINSAISNEVQRRIDLGADAHFVDNHGAVRANWNTGLADPDGVHPTDAGYKVIAENWFNTKLSTLIAKDATVIPAIISLLLDD